MQLVLEFCARRLGPVVEAMRQVLDEAAYTVSAWMESEHAYVPTDEKLEPVASRLEKGHTASFVVYPRLANVRYALVTAPSFGGAPLSLYMGTIEYTSGDYEKWWDLLLAVPELTVVCLGFEEGVELDDLHLDADTFPWDQWPLVLGALRTTGSSGEAWIVRNGPEMRWFTQVSRQ